MRARHTLGWWAVACVGVLIGTSYAAWAVRPPTPPVTVIVAEEDQCPAETFRVERTPAGLVCTIDR